MRIPRREVHLALRRKDLLSAVLHIKGLEVLIEAVGKAVNDGNNARQQQKDKDNAYNLCRYLTFALHSSPP